jgi:hypothetical protein
MVIACILCGGVLETMLVITGLGVLCKWLKKRHKKDQCECCKKHDKETK